MGNFGQSPKTGISPADWQEVGHGSVGFTDVDVVETIPGKYPLVHFVHLQSGLHLGERKAKESSTVLKARFCVC
jgi:hypothetical protein